MNVISASMQDCIDEYNRVQSIGMQANMVLDIPLQRLSDEYNTLEIFLKGVSNA